MKILRITIIMLFLVMSAGAVCAADNLSGDIAGDDNSHVLNAVQDDIYSAGEPKTFTDLKNDVSNSSGVFDVMDDYKFNNGTDDASEPIYIEKNNFIINGNGHTIDAGNQSAIFGINAVNVTINNLTLINANSNRGSALIIYSGYSLTTNNVNFINNTADTGVIFVGGNYTSNSDRFKDSSSANFGTIYLVDGKSTFNDAVMTSSKILDWGFIYTENDRVEIYISNSTFANATSKYSTAVRGFKKTVIRNSKFINLHSQITAGAIALKEMVLAEIVDCTFVNVTSKRNAGAIFADANEENSSAVFVVDSNFIDCYSGFGGAILQLKGNLTVNRCNFTNNSALFDGGAIYVSYVTIVVANSSFKQNHAQYDGDRGSYAGAIYGDASGLNVWESSFINNSAQYGGAIYSYDSGYDIDKCNFADNVNLYGDLDDIYTMFDWPDPTLKNNTYSSEYSYNTNKTRYASIVDTSGMKLTLLNNSIDVSKVPSKFDLRDWGWSTPVRDQGRMGSCWAFGTSAAMESAILRFLGIGMDISESNLRDLSLQYSQYGTIKTLEGSSVFSAVHYALSWFGVISSEYDVYDQLGKISPIFAANGSVHFQDVVYLPTISNETGIDLIKKAILKYGALTVNYHAAQSAPYLNVKTSAQYINESFVGDHSVSLIGWDDSYSASNFLITPPGDGAWIIKNSWGTDYGDKGYYYISYYDKTFATSMKPMAFILENTVEYNKNYQYDIGGKASEIVNSTEAINSYVAVADDLIAGVGTYFNETGVEYLVEIYVNDVLRLSQSGLSPFAGFHTIKLDSYVPIEQGDKFDVYIKSNWVPALINSRQKYMNGTSKAKIDGKWIDISSEESICSIKAYTVADDTKIINNKDISVDYSGGKYFSVKVVTGNGHAVGIGEKVTFTINKKTTTVTTDKNGIAKIKIVDVPKKYTITTKYKGKTYTNKVTVKQVLTASKVNVKKTAKSFTLKAKLKVNGKLVKGKVITFKFNGKTYKVKTNAKGIAQKKLNKNVIKKLKKGKTYAVKVTYLKDTIKTTVKVK